MRTLLRACWNCLRWFGEGIAAELESLGSEWAFAREVRSREPMDDETFWATSYKKDGIPFEIPIAVRRIYGEQLGHDYRKLRERLRPADARYRYGGDGDGNRGGARRSDRRR